MFYMTCILSILYHNLNALGPLNAEYSGINCLNISLGDWNLQYECWLVVLRLNVPVNNFSVMSGRSHRFLGN